MTKTNNNKKKYITMISNYIYIYCHFVYGVFVAEVIQFTWKNRKQKKKQKKSNNQPTIIAKREKKDLYTYYK